MKGVEGEQLVEKREVLTRRRRGEERGREGREEGGGEERRTLQLCHGLRC